MSIQRIGISDSPDKNLANVADQKQQYYDSVFRPLNRQLIGDVNSTALVDTAKDNADRRFTDTVARNKRQRSRLGVVDTALDQKRNDYATSLSQGVNFDTQVNDARVEQYERNVGLRNEMVNVGRGISDQATDGLSTAAALQTQRENNNANIKAQNKAAQNQTNGQIAGMAMMAMMMM
ncbi:MAG: hypothetical protein ACRBBW_20550 [Cellvibrionaceae bacterium]